MCRTVCKKLPKYNVRLTNRHRTSYSAVRTTTKSTSTIKWPRTTTRGPQKHSTPHALTHVYRSAEQREINLHTRYQSTRGECASGGGGGDARASRVRSLSRAAPLRPSHTLSHIHALTHERSRRHTRLSLSPRSCPPMPLALSLARAPHTRVPTAPTAPHAPKGCLLSPISGSAEGCHSPHPIPQKHTLSLSHLSHRALTANSTLSARVVTQTGVSASFVRR